MGHIKLITLGTPEHSKLVKNSLKFCLYALGKKSEKSKKKWVINIHRLSYEVLTIKYDKDQNFNYRWSRAGLQIFHNTTMTGLIHETITKAAITKLFSCIIYSW